MSDPATITAVALSMGEASIGRALASIEAQTRPVDAVLQIVDVSPFHRALNAAAARVQTEYFIQVDADMVLDPDCVARLSESCADHIGVVLGHLRDALYGRVQAVKLWRTEPFGDLGFPDDVSPDTRFISMLSDAGLAAVHALRFEGRNPRLWHTFGEHAPDYTSAYTWQKHLRDGRRLRHRGQSAAVSYHLDVLRRSPHQSAVYARVGLAQGLLLEWTGDQQDGRPGDASWRKLADFLARPTAAVTGRKVRPGPAVSAGGLFSSWHRAGLELARDGDRCGLEAAVRQLCRVGWRWRWIAEVALYRGLMNGLTGSPPAARDWTLLRGLYDAGGSTGIVRDLLANVASHFQPRLGA